MEKKFETFVNNYINGNISTFRKDLNKLSKRDLILFLKYCNEYCEEINIFNVEKYLN